MDVEEERRKATRIIAHLKTPFILGSPTSPRKTAHFMRLLNSFGIEKLTLKFICFLEGCKGLATKSICLYAKQLSNTKTIYMFCQQFKKLTDHTILQYQKQ